MITETTDKTDEREKEATTVQGPCLFTDEGCLPLTHIVAIRRTYRTESYPTIRIYAEGPQTFTYTIGVVEDEETARKYLRDIPLSVRSSIRRFREEGLTLDLYDTALIPRKR